MTIALLTVTLSPATQAFDFSVKIIDQSGAPVANVAIEIPLRPALADASVVVMDQIDRRFQPLVVSARQGQLINFPNQDNIRHHVYSFSPAKTFSTELYANEPVDPIHLDKPGVVVLGCNIHDSMVGYIFVSAWQDVATSDDSGLIHFTQLAGRPDSVNLWHPWINASESMQIDTSSLAPGEQLEIRVDVEKPVQNFGFRALTSE